MKLKNLVILIFSVSIVFACNKKDTVKEIVETYTIEQLNQVFKYKLDSTSTIQLPKDLKELSEAKLDTISESMKVIYGNDDRKDFYQEVDTSKMNNSHGVVALVRKSYLEPKGGDLFNLLTIPFYEKVNLCKGEKFSQQPVVAYCSGFAVAKNLIITAGHCIKTQEDLQSTRFIFDYKAMDSLNIKTTFDSKLILTGKRIISTVLDVEKGIDYAVIEVNETIPSNRILIVNGDSKMRVQQKIYVIGHPVGLPQKISGGAYVGGNDHPQYYTANLDTYGGNSGSPVFDATTHKVEGILVRGETDFIKVGTCRISNPCPDIGCNGEDVSRTSQFYSIIKPFQ